MPQMHSEEYLAFERLHERERQMKQQHQFIHQRDSRLGNFQRMKGNIGGFFKALGRRMLKVEQHSEHVV